MTPRAAVDVVVVGGRVAGASTALLLARAGVRVAVVERGARGSDTLSTHALMRAGVLQLSRWGVLDDVRAAGTPPVGRTTFHYGTEESVEVSIRPSPGVDALYAPRRHLLDRLLVDAAAEAGAVVLHETAVTGLLTDPDGRVRGVRTRSREGRELELTARHTVGADGIRSLVAAGVGAPVDRVGGPGGATLFRYFADVPADGYHWAYGTAPTSAPTSAPAAVPGPVPSAGAGLIPTNEGATCVFVGTTAVRMRELRRGGVEAAFDRLLALGGPALLDRVAAGTPVSRMHGWAGIDGYVRRSWGPGWALVGDAGYFKDPCTAHGMTDALRDAELLTDALLDVLGCRIPEAQALRGYQTTRDRLSAGLFTATEAIAGYRWSLDEVRGQLRRLNAAMSDEVDLLTDRPVQAGGRAPTGRLEHPDRPPASAFVPPDRRRVAG